MNFDLKRGLLILLIGLTVVVWTWQMLPKKRDFHKYGDLRFSQSSNSGALKKSANVPPEESRLPADRIEYLLLGQAEGKSKLEKMSDLIKRDYSTPINFWGKVVDQNGNPIPNVKATIVIDGQIRKSEHLVYSDEVGRFELLGKRGARARVKVSLGGYAPTADKEIGSDVSSRTIYYTAKAMPAYAPPTREHPQVFVLRKRNPPANIAHSESKGAPVEKSGEPEKVSLKTGARIIEFEVRCWSSCLVPFTYDKYDWRAEIKVLGGKLRSIAEFDPVIAPAGGYQSFFKLEMPKNMEGNWIRNSPNGQKDFWIQFDDGTYGKARVEVKTGRKHEVDAEVWYNLDGTNIFE